MDVHTGPDVPVSASLLDRIEAKALDGQVVKALRMCISLGGRAGSAQLRDWAKRELHGYDGVADLPDYRIINANLYVNWVNAFWRRTGQQISSNQLPDFAQEHISEEVEMRHPIPALRKLAESAEREHQSIRLSPPGAMDIVGYMNGTGGLQGAQITSLYWAVDPAAVHSITERVCTDIVALVAEIRAGMSDEDLPSQAHATQAAVQIVIGGDNNRVEVTDTSQVQGSVYGGTAESRSTLRNVWWVVGIVGTLGGLVLACMEAVA